jgi:hypothetical protein
VTAGAALLGTTVAALLAAVLALGRGAAVTTLLLAAVLGRGTAVAALVLVVVVVSLVSVSGTATNEHQR